MTSVILYQMGKVGSSSLKGTLNHYKFKSLHIHRYFWTNNERPVSLMPFLLKLKQNRILKKLLKAEKVKVITFYRDPLPRNISSFFQNLDIYFSKKERKNLSYEILKHKFNSSFRFHDTPNNWFDLELKRKLNLDIFEIPFDKEKGFVIIKKGSVEVFVCITNKLNTLENELAEFLEVDEFKLLSKNIGEEKWYRKHYKEFREKYKPTQEMLDQLYKSKTINYFFTPNQIETLRNKWLDDKA